MVNEKTVLVILMVAFFGMILLSGKGTGAIADTLTSASISPGAQPANTNWQSTSTGSQPTNTGGQPAAQFATSASGAQEVQLTVRGGNYMPNPIRVKKGIPVKLIADISSVRGCASSIVIPEFGVSKFVRAADNVIEFTPTKSGTFKFSCSMGMYRGTIVVEEADGTVAAYTGTAAPVATGSCKMGGGGCGCGG